MTLRQRMKRLCFLLFALLGSASASSLFSSEEDGKETDAFKMNREDAYANLVELITQMEENIDNQFKDLRKENNLHRITKNGGFRGFSKAMLHRSNNGHDKSRTNIALGKPTFQSSISSNGQPQYAVDGDRRAIYYPRSVAEPRCTHTKLEGNPWWAVDLQKAETVKEIYIVNRAECCSSRLHDFTVTLTDVDPTESNPILSDNKTCVAYAGDAPNRPITLTCDSPVKGRYLVVHIPGPKRILTLCEVEVYGEQTEEKVMKPAEKKQAKKTVDDLVDDIEDLPVEDFSIEEQMGDDDMDDSFSWD